MSGMDIAFRDIIGYWPSVGALASDLQEKQATVEKWRTRNRIPSRAWHKLLDSAETRGIQLTGDVLIEIEGRR